MGDIDLVSLFDKRPKLLENRPMLLQGDRPLATMLRDRVPEDPQEPIVEPGIARQWTEANLPFRGQVRQRIAERTVEDIRRRRTIDGLSTRIATAAVTPITTEIEGMVTERIRQRLNQQAQRAVSSAGDN